MTTYISNDAGENVGGPFASDAEACRWFLDMGRVGDCLADSPESMGDEPMARLVEEILEAQVRFDRDGCVVVIKQPR